MVLVQAHVWMLALVTKASPGILAFGFAVACACILVCKHDQLVNIFTDSKRSSMRNSLSSRNSFKIAFQADAVISSSDKEGDFDSNEASQKMQIPGLWGLSERRNLVTLEPGNCAIDLAKTLKTGR